MWEGGVHGSHEALLLQGAGAGAHDHPYAHGGHASALLPWLGPAAAALPHMPFAAAAHDPAAAFAYCDAGLFGGGAVDQHHAAAGGGGGGAGSKMSGLFGSLQAEFGRMTAKEIMDAKALAASRSHSEAERRRRQRINGHLAKLRSLLPNTTKTDKASLLAEVIEHVKELKRQTSAMMVAAGDGGGAAAQQQLMLPTEADELVVDAVADGEGRFVVRASLCCEDRPDLIPDIVRALAALRLRARRAEIATLGGRVRNVLLISAGADAAEADDNGDDDDGCAASHRRHECVASIQEALRGVIDRRTASSDTSSGGGSGGSIKRQRMIGAQDPQGSV